MRRFRVMDSPIGALLLVEGDEGLETIEFCDGSPAPPAGALEGGETTARATRQLDEYFRGKRREFSLRLAPRGTPFQLEVWRALEALPYGTTASYADVARKIGRPAATRAVGAANGRNPLPIVLPCHRVVGRDGSLTGYGGGLERKLWLLRHEGARI